MKKIMFNDKMGLTQAVLNGSKTMTRRNIKLHDGCSIERITLNGRDVYYFKNANINGHGSINGVNVSNFDGFVIAKAQYKIGEVVAIAQSYNNCLYDAHTEIEIDGKDYLMCETKGWDNKMFVKAELMLHHIRITNVRIERLQDISDDDCLKDGIELIGSMYHFKDCNKNEMEHYTTPFGAYATLINKVSGKGTWESNPFVFVYEFEVVD